MAGRLRRHWKGLTVSAIAAVVILVVGVPFVYINFIEGDQPAPLSLTDLSSSDVPEESSMTSPASNDSLPTEGAGASDDEVAASADTSPVDAADAADRSPADLDGTWTIGAGSQAGYRVEEVLAGQSTVAVGRTDSVTGSLTISENTVTAADITVQVADIASDNGQRDRQFTGRIMNADQFPTATFTLTEPLTLDLTLDDGATLSTTGSLDLHGVAKEVTFPLTVQLTDSGLAATGTIDIAYADYGINNPSVGGFVSVGESGTIEFLLVATQS